MATVAAVSLLLSCSTAEDGAREGSPSRQAGGSPGVTPTGQAAPETPDGGRAAVDKAAPTGPPARRAGDLAQQLQQAAAALHGPRATDSDVRRAAEFHQIAVRGLAGAPGGFRRRVVALLPRRTAAAVRDDLVAAESLAALADPQPRLPRWRIVAPPPPEELLGHYSRAQRRTGVHWTYLAAIHLVETRMGRIRGTSTAGARGPMQFLPSTWELYGGGGDINEHRDAILAAARLLKANGAPSDMARALYHYNPSENYVRAVTAHARTMRRSESAYHGYWHWRVLYRHIRGVYVLPVGYPRNPAVLISRS